MGRISNDPQKVVIFATIVIILLFAIVIFLSVY